jgi:hypothetical protein
MVTFTPETYKSFINDNIIIDKAMIAMIMAYTFLISQNSWMELTKFPHPYL